jgi:predicted nucleic acid-binding protein
MADYFFDTSALVKRRVIEAGSTWVRSLLRAKAAHGLYIARITAVEMKAAITRRQQGGHLSRPQADAMLGHFRRHLVQRYHIIELTSALFDEAMRVARKHQLRAYDAVQLAAALALHRRHDEAGLGPVTLVSADRELNDAAQAEGLMVEDPNAHP